MKHKVIALTGGIGSGKSVAGKYLAQKGFSVIDCDVLSRQVADNKEVIQTVGLLLGQEYIKDGKIDRKAVRNKIFFDSNLRNRYNALFFDKIKSLLIDAIDNAQSDVFVEIPLIDAFDFNWTEVWLIDSDKQTRINRAALRDNVSAQNATVIVESQRQTDNFTRAIANDGTLEEFYQNLDIALLESKVTVEVQE